MKSLCILCSLKAFFMDAEENGAEDFLHRISKQVWPTLHPEKKLDKKRYFLKSKNVSCAEGAE